MATALDVAKYILETQDEMTTVKLQKLVYYCQAWSLVWEEKPLFAERIEAWANGPVVPALFHYHQGMYLLSAATLTCGDSANLTSDEKEVIDTVLKGYAEKSTQWLVALTHLEDPWKDARAAAKAQPGERCNQESTLGALLEYYSGLGD